MTLSVSGGGFFGDSRANLEPSFGRTVLIVVEVSFHLFYAWWNIDCLTRKMDERDGAEEEEALLEEEEETGEVI